MHLHHSHMGLGKNGKEALLRHDFKAKTIHFLNAMKHFSLALKSDLI